MMLFDSHCHLDDRAFEGDMAAAIHRAKEAGVSEMMIVGTNKKSSERCVEIARTTPGVYASVGLHPHDAESCDDAALDFLKRLATEPQVKAWGETGLDFNRMRSPLADQEKWFVRQIEAACELSLPLIFHERDSKGRFLEILKSDFPSRAGGVVHCFSGDRDDLEQYLKLGLRIGITGILTIKGRGAALREMAPLIPLDRILIETDAPYLTPAPQKNKTRRNEPAFVASVLHRLADVLNQDPETLAAITRKNALDLFGIEADLHAGPV
jgi:TatD DNase family protein